VPRCPRWLSADAKAEWNRLAGELWQLGLLTNLDTALFAGYCEIYATWRAAVKLVDENGPTYRAGDLTKRHPAVAIASQACRDMLASAQHFGLTPAARQRLHVEPMAAPSEKARFFRDPLTQLLEENNA
jgi:P27 family predicted phage terminase small subunit